MCTLYTYFIIPRLPKYVIMIKSNPVTWFEIPVLNLDRAIDFYNHVFDFTLKQVVMGDTKMAWFPYDEAKNGCSGALIYNPAYYTPSEKQGVVIYFACDDVANTMDKARTAGAQILQEKKQISPEHGYMGVLIDCEGNRIALYSNV